jgi:hypothetical protein
VGVPLTLVPSDNVEDAGVFVGEWTDEQGGPVPEDQLTAYLGAEHGSWGDIVFLRFASGARISRRGCSSATANVTSAEKSPRHPVPHVAVVKVSATTLPLASTILMLTVASNTSAVRRS